MVALFFWHVACVLLKSKHFISLNFSCAMSAGSILWYMSQPNSRCLTNFSDQQHACHMPQNSLAISDTLYKHFLFSSAVSHGIHNLLEDNCAQFCHPQNLLASKRKQSIMIIIIIITINTIIIIIRQLFST